MRQRMRAAYVGGPGTELMMPTLTMSPMDVRLLQSTPTAVFTEAEVAALPEPVRRYLTAAIAPGTPLAHATRITMRGQLKLGRWLPFRAVELLNPHRGFRWAARVAGVISGSDGYAGGWGQLDWSLLGLLSVASGTGADISRSAAGRAAGEAFWLPTTLLPRYGVRWAVDDDHHLRARFEVDGLPCDLRLTIADDARLTSVALDRWGDPDRTGSWDWHRFGFDVTGYATFGGLTVPASGRAGWYHGTDRWAQGEFFRCRVTDLEPVT